jgi:hypothetical protein
MATFKANKYEPRPVCARHYNPATKKITEYKSAENADLYEILDDMTLAMDAGVVDTWRWPQQFFADRGSFDDFIDLLESYDECYRITDQWWNTLAMLADTVDCEEQFTHTDDMARAIVIKCEEDGLLDWSKNKKLRYTQAQYEAATLESTYGYGLGCFEGRDYTAQRAAEAIASYCRTYSDYPSLSKDAITAAYRKGEAEHEAVKAKLKAKKAPAKKATAKKAR